MEYDALVVGGGHAGIEASLALSRIGFRTILVTQNLDTIGQLSCNPAVGGLAKGNMVREIDAMGGQMGHLIDETMLQFRVLNRSRGPAVQAPRAQADKPAYRQKAKHTLELQKGLDLFQDTIVNLITSPVNAPSLSDMDPALWCNRQVTGVLTERGHTIEAKAVVLTTGTFMSGKIFIGEYENQNGRIGEPAAMGLGAALRELGFRVGRLKTGTPARIHRRSLDLDKMEIQFGDDEVFPFSFTRKGMKRPALPCYITYTNSRTHQIIRDNLDRSPLFSGRIEGNGPRYCPSIEDKVVKFPDRDRHHVFVEPEGLETEEMYLNGLSTSLPEEVQIQFIQSISGMERAQLLRPGYAVEYDYLNPIDLTSALESKRMRNLFIAGQTNGTSGYEEAAAQGLMAGINAARRLQGKSPIVLDRSEAYTGVLIDDLVTLGTEEPYRMFTSRAEYRIALRHDNADRRLFVKGIEAGLHSSKAVESFTAKCDRIEEIRQLLCTRTLSEAEALAGPWDSRKGGEKFDFILRDPEVSLIQLIHLEPKIAMDTPQDWLHQIELDVKYEGYLKREERHVRRFKRMEHQRIPGNMEWDAVPGLSAEAREKLKAVRPASVGQASRIPGVRSSDIAIFLIQLERRRYQTSAS
ncbi:MAG: tRNA uridine-5-carboxymethylaminomethyl(34) synthesis enzyme MnmG [spirochete symbiont of Stewartia floridana]|nr:MAG: tRNA uridine-5-carboxymethylaminomethyl(34) synthesis enzyme MnmG [spirochete symbiont of Stewartia floridana]